MRDVYLVFHQPWQVEVEVSSTLEVTNCKTFAGNPTMSVYLAVCSLVGCCRAPLTGSMTTPNPEMSAEDLACRTEFRRASVSLPYLQQVVVPGVGQADWDGGAAVHVHPLLHPQQRQVVAGQDVVEVLGPVPARVHHDGGHRPTVHLPGLGPEAEV